MGENGDKAVVVTRRQVPLPGNFEGATGPRQADLWPRWLKRFERYRIASGLCDDSEEEQVGMLLYSMGDCADDILVTLSIDEEKSSYKEVVDALNGYYGVRRNVITERARFNRRKQAQGESVDAFIQDLYQLAQNCEYGTLREQLIRDKIVVGVLDEGLSDKLQAKRDLTLDEAVEMSRQAEARKQNRELIRGEAKPVSVDYVKGQAKVKPRSQGQGQKPTQDKQRRQGEAQCPHCCRPFHERKDCPARNSRCHKCGGYGHFRCACTNPKKKPDKKVHEVEAEEEARPFLGEICGQRDFWAVQVEVNGFLTDFKLDTGAAVTIVSDSVPWLEGQELKPATQTLRGPGHSQLSVLGTLDATLTTRDKELQEVVYVLKDQACSLLSKRACEGLGLVKVSEDVHEVKEESPNFRAEYPELFEGLGELKTEYHISLRPGVEPVCLYTACKVPHPMLPQVEKELNSMIRQGVISPVTTPTDWCSGMVPVPKPNGRVRICVDLTNLNKAVERAWPSLGKVCYSPSWMQIVVFGKFRWMRSRGC